MATFRTGINGSPGVTTDWRSLTVAKITSKQVPASGPLAGRFVYEWIEQAFDPATGESQDSPSPRIGIYTSATSFSNILLDVNDTEFEVDDYVWCRLKGQVYGTAVYESAYLTTNVAGDGLCGGCGWMADVPDTTCFKFRVMGGSGRCDCIVGETFLESGSGFWVPALDGWLASQMKDTCCGCGGAVFKITGATTATLSFTSFHVSCESGSAGGLFTLALDLECCGVNPETGKPFAQFRGYGPDACEDPQLPCDNTFVVVVECYDCPDPVCGCCCTDYSPYSWYNMAVISFADDTLNGSWVWEYNGSTDCKWTATCGEITSTIEYSSDGGGVVRLTHGTFVYEIARSSWTCHGDNSMAYVSGSGGHPAIVTLKPAQVLDPAETPCDLPDSLSVELISGVCPAMTAVVTVTRSTPGVGPWTYGTAGSLVVTVECTAFGKFQVAVSNECAAVPTPIGFVASTAPADPDTSEWNPMELTWTGVAIVGTPAVPDCCSEGDLTIIVRE